MTLAAPILLSALLSLPLVTSAPLAVAQSAFDIATPEQYLARMDSNGDGRVDLVEYQNHLGRAARDMDSNGDGLLSASELPPGPRTRNGKPVSLARQREVHAQRFHLQDRNRDNFLDAVELAAPPR